MKNENLYYNLQHNHVTTWTAEYFVNDFKSCSFNKTVLADNSMSGTYTDCSFIGADFSNCAISRCTFIDCDFTTAVFSNTTMYSSTFIGCSFSGATLLKTIGVSTCHFKLSCRGVLGMKTDLDVKIAGSAFVLTPKVSVNFTEKYAMPLKHKQNESKQQKLLVETNPLVEPNLLPKVGYYRSSPSKISLSQKTSNSDIDDTEYDDNWCYGYRHTMGGGYHSTHKYKYGYMSNAVLLCSNIEEYEQCLKSIS